MSASSLLVGGRMKTWKGPPGFPAELLSWKSWKLLSTFPNTAHLLPPPRTGARMDDPKFHISHRSSSVPIRGVPRKGEMALEAEERGLGGRWAGLCPERLWLSIPEVSKVRVDGT